MRRQKRDLTKAQFAAKCAALGFYPDFLGYWSLGNGLSVYPRNAGDRRRDQLAYMVACHEKHILALIAKDHARDIFPR